MRYTKTMILAVAAALAAPAQADEGWSGDVTLGYLATSGNSDSSSINAGTNVNFERGRWLHNLHASALGAEDSGQTTAEAYTLGFKSEWEINDVSYLYGLAEWQKDKFSGYDQQITESIGYGRKLIDTEAMSWNAEVGVGARQSDLRDGTSENESILRAATNFRRALTETSEFNANLQVESGEENTNVQSLLAIKARLLGDLALVASYRIKYNSEVPAGSEKTDRFTAISLEYAF